MAKTRLTPLALSAPGWLGGPLPYSRKLSKDNILPEEELDKLMDNIVELFGNQFTRDKAYDGLASKDLIPTITKCINNKGQ